MRGLKVYKSADCDRQLLEGKTVCVIGYGPQGRAYCLNLRDSGCRVTAALRSGSDSIAVARRDGVTVVSPDEAATAAIVVMAFPDHEQPQFYDRYLKGRLSKPQTLVFLSGLNAHFGNFEPDPLHDLVLIAPHGPGSDLRSRYLSGEGLSCFLAVAADRSGRAQSIGLALADALGCGNAGIFETSFKDEAIGDLFGEQALLVGGLAGITMAAFDKLVEQGLDQESAYLETVAQLKLLVNMVEQHGPVGMMERVSRTAQAGSLMAMLLIFNEDFDQRLQQIYEFVASGEFNKFLKREAASGFVKTEEMMAMLRSDPCQKAVEEFNRRKEEQE